MAEPDDKLIKHADPEAKAKAAEKMQATIKSQEKHSKFKLPTKDDKRSESGEPSVDVKKTKQTLSHVKVYAPFHVYYEDDAYSVSAVNETGPFDILPGHKNFMTLLIPCDIVIQSARGEQRIKIETGVMHVRHNKVSVFLDV